MTESEELELACQYKAGELQKEFAAAEAACGARKQKGIASLLSNAMKQHLEEHRLGPLSAGKTHIDECGEYCHCTTFDGDKGYRLNCYNDCGRPPRHSGPCDCLKEEHNFH